MTDAPSFEQILAKYASNHNNTGTDKTTSHSYGRLYSELFAPLRDSARRVLEIGVYSGASVLAMADYFERAQVVGLDVTLKRIRFGQDHPRISFVLGDGTSPLVASLASTQGTAGAEPVPFDLILDDGSHRIQDQLASLQAFAPFLEKTRGLFVIEDIASDAYKADFEKTAARCSPRLELVAWHDLRQQKNQFDDIVAVFKVAAD